MANSKWGCTNCKKRFPREQFIVANVGKFCCDECRREYALNGVGLKKALDFAQKEQRKKDRIEKAESKIAEKERRSESRERKKSTKKLNDWKVSLRKLIQQWVRTVRDKGHNCCTCGNPLATEGGHYISVGSNPDLQFEETNIHPQCHECNCYNSGRRAEYDKYIIMRYGRDHFDWLNGPHPSLKDVFPHWSDYENEIKRYRKLLRDEGIKPCR